MSNVKIVNLVKEKLNFVNINIRNNVTDLLSKDNLNKNQIVNSLNSIDTSSIDTEEREILGDVYFIIANELNLDINYELNRWAYGDYIADSISNTKKEKYFEYTQKCIHCGSIIGAKIHGFNSEIPDLWCIVKCNSCKGKSILSFNNGVTGFTLINIQLLGSFPKSQISREEVDKML